MSLLVAAEETSGLKAHSHLLQWSAASAVDCINTEMEKFLSLCGNETVHCRICTSVNEPKGTLQRQGVILCFIRSIMNGQRNRTDHIIYALMKEDGIVKNRDTV